MPHPGHLLRDVGKEISYAYSERKLINVFNLWGYHSRAKASRFKRAQYSEYGWKRQKSGCRKRLWNQVWSTNNENCKLGLWIALGGHPVPRSSRLPPCVSASRTESKAGVSWLKSWELLFFIFFFYFNQALSTLVVIPVFKCSLIFINALYKHSTAFFRGSWGNPAIPITCGAERGTCKEVSVWLSGSEVHLRIPLGT